jgi:hypothetical protein
MRDTEKTCGAAGASQVAAELARFGALPHPPNPFDILDRARVQREPPDGDSDASGDDFGRPSRAMWLGVDTPLRVGHG